MFEWFKRPKYTEQTTATDDMMLGDNPYTIQSGPYGSKGYSVGVDDDGKTTLRIVTGTALILMAMGEDETKRLIALLCATLPKEETT